MDDADREAGVFISSSLPDSLQVAFQGLLSTTVHLEVTSSAASAIGNDLREQLIISFAVFTDNQI